MIISDNYEPEVQDNECTNRGNGVDVDDNDLKQMVLPNTQDENDENGISRAGSNNSSLMDLPDELLVVIVHLFKLEDIKSLSVLLFKICQNLPGRITTTRGMTTEMRARLLNSDYPICISAMNRLQKPLVFSTRIWTNGFILIFCLLY